MARVQCFLLEPTNRVKRKLRRYSNNNRWDSALNKSVYDNPCPLSGGYHDAETLIEDGLAEMTDNGSYKGGGDFWPHDDPRWPMHCACGYAFPDSDAWQLFNELVYRRTDTGDEMTLRDAAPGAMWWCPWMGDCWHPQLGKLFSVKLPDGTDWMPDMQASNCTMPDDHNQERHHCWVIEGATLPRITVGKGGVTCGAGAGSIQSTRYHGFLRNGYLED